MWVASWQWIVGKWTCLHLNIYFFENKKLYWEFYFVLFRSGNIPKGTRYQVALLFHPVYFFFTEYKAASWSANQEKFLILNEPEDSLVYIQRTRNWTLSEASFISVRTLQVCPISVNFDSKLFFHSCEVHLLSFICKVVSRHIRQVCNLLCLHRGSLKSQDVMYV